MCSLPAQQEENGAWCWESSQLLSVSEVPATEEESTALVYQTRIIPNNHANIFPSTHREVWSSFLIKEISLYNREMPQPINTDSYGPPSLVNTPIEYKAQGAPM